MATAGKLTQKDIYGTAKDWIIWLSFILGAPLFLFYTLGAYPLVDQNDPILVYVPAAGFVVGFVLLCIGQRALFPWGGAAPLYKWLGVIALSVAFAIAATGGYLTLNGILDKEVSTHATYGVLAKRRTKGGRTLYLRSQSSEEAGSIKLSISPREYDRAKAGNHVVLDIKPGFFGRPWIAAYRIVPAA